MLANAASKRRENGWSQGAGTAAACWGRVRDSTRWPRNADAIGMSLRLLTSVLILTVGAFAQAQPGGRPAAQPTPAPTTKPASEPGKAAAEAGRCGSSSGPISTMQFDPETGWPIVGPPPPAAPAKTPPAKAGNQGGAANPANPTDPTNAGGSRDAAGGGALRRVRAAVAAGTDPERAAAGVRHRTRLAAERRVEDRAHTRGIQEARGCRGLVAAHHLRRTGRGDRPARGHAHRRLPVQRARPARGPRTGARSGGSAPRCSPSCAACRGRRSTTWRART